MNNKKKNVLVISDSECFVNSVPVVECAVISSVTFSPGNMLVFVQSDQLVSYMETEL